MGRIMIVEDNALISDCLKNIIVSIDSTLEVYSTGYASLALEQAKINSVDVFVLDIELLDYPGTQLADQLRRMEQYVLTPILFITSDGCRELEAYRNVQCYKFITKPFETEAVKTILKTVIQHGIRKEAPQDRLMLKQRGYTLSVLQQDILYLEAVGRKISVVTRYEVLEVSKQTLGGLLTHLNQGFFQCHKGFVVNKAWISGIDRVHQTIVLNEKRGAIPYGDKFKDRLSEVLE